MQLRVSPWFTDKSIEFLNGVFKWYPNLFQDRLKVLEFGGGNSTLYFLSKGCQIVTVEDHPDYISKLKALAEQLNSQVFVIQHISELQQALDKADLVIIKAASFGQLGISLFEQFSWPLIVNDGIDRKEVLRIIQRTALNSLLILDNIEYAANWGRLARSSGKTETIRQYRNFLRDTNWQGFMFEQPEGRDGHSVADRHGWECPTRWITGIFWHQQHVFRQLMVTDKGLPIVNLEGLDDSDLNSVEQRCPFDWDKNQWAIEEFPNSLDLKLARGYD